MVTGRLIVLRARPSSGYPTQAPSAAMLTALGLLDRSALRKWLLEGRLGVAKGKRASDNLGDVNVSINDDKLPVVREVSTIPMISAEQYQHVGRYAGAIVMSVFEQIGGVQRMAAWADSNPTDYFTKIFTKMISRSQQVDVSGTLTIDDAINRLERMATPIEASFEEVTLEYDL